MAYQARQQDEAVRKRMSETGATVASHLLEAERTAAVMQDSVRWRGSFAAIAAEHDKAMQAVLGGATAAAATQSALEDISRQVDSLKAARAAMAPTAATALAAAVNYNNDIQKMLGGATAAQAALPNIGRHGDSLATARAAMAPTAATALAAAVNCNNDIQKMLGDATAAAQAALSDINLRTRSLATLGAISDPGVHQFAKILHGQFGGITDALKAHRLHTAVLPHRQLPETMRQLSMKPHLVDVAASAANLIQSVGLSRVLATDIQHIARAASQTDLSANITNPSDHEALDHESALHEIVEPSLEEADFNLLLVLVVVAVFPALLATSMAHMTQAAQDLLFMLRLLGKLTQAEDAIPGALLLNEIIRSIRRNRGR